MIIRKILPLLFVGIALLGASGVPIGDMSSDMLGIEYAGIFSGQTITKAEVPSRFQAHYFMLRYAPVPYVLISGGIGGANMETDVYDSTKFKGTMGFSPTGELTLFTPEFARLLKVNAGCGIRLITSSDEEYRYTTTVINPYAGLLFAVSRIGDIGIGAKGNIMSGTMKLKNVESSFSNNNYVHGYVTGTLHSLYGRSYASITFDISPASSKDWSFGPNEAAISLQVGYFLKTMREPEVTAEGGVGQGGSRDLDTMRVQQDKMADKMKEQD